MGLRSPQHPSRGTLTPTMALPSLATCNTLESFEMHTFHKILLPVDGSTTSNRALDMAIKLASGGPVQLHLVHSVDELAYMSGYEYAADLFAMARDYGQKILDEAAQKAKSAGVTVDVKLIDLPAQRLGETVATEAREWGADLIVVGTHGRKGIGRVFLGSGAEQIIRLSPVPTLVVRGE
jgi:nucleotide-binding universal stress UspA family protein